MSRVWVNGTLTDKADARVSLFDHGLLYGDGVWEHLRVFGGKLFRPADHAAHLFAAAAALGIDIPLSPPELVAAVDATVRANDRTDGYIRVVVTRGPGTIGPDPRKVDPQVFITAEEYYPFPLELAGHGLHVVTAPVRIDAGDPLARVRALGRPHVVQAKRFALSRGCLDAVLVAHDGRVLGTTEGSLFVVNGGAARLADGGVPDAAAAAVGAEPAAVSVDDLSVADEAFLAGTACGVIAVVRLDGRDIGTGREGPVTRATRERFRVLARPGSAPGTPSEPAGPPPSPL